MLVWLTLPFYDFCGFRSVAVNSVYKLQFFTFIAYNVDAGYRAEADQFIFSLYIKCPSKTGGLLQHEQLLVSGWRCTFHMVAHKGHPSSVEETIL